MSRNITKVVFFALVALWACQVDEEDPSLTTTDDLSETSSPAPVNTSLLAPPERQPSGLTDVSDSLDALLEYGELEGACEAYFSGQRDRRTRLLCGKAMFFYEGFGAQGIPKSLVNFLTTRFPEELIGSGHSAFGLIEDPFGKKGRPLGLVDGAPLTGGSLGPIPTLAFGCASCHFGQLPDGRYAVGAPNTQYDYGGHLLAMTLAPQVINPLFRRRDHHTDALARIQPIEDHLNANQGLRREMALSMLSLLEVMSSVPQIPKADEGHMAAWGPGVMDFAMQPAPVDDGVHVVSRIPVLWGLPSAEEAADAGAPHGLLGWTGVEPSVMSFVRSFARYSQNAEGWTDERLAPLAEYVLSLSPPPSPDPLSEEERRVGMEAFEAADCASCHQGPSGMGLQAYGFDEVGTASALIDYGQPDDDGIQCCGLDDGTGTLIATRGVKAPRLVGLWSLDSFLHNGSVPSLEALLCLQERPQVDDRVYGSQGHRFGCDASEADRNAIIRLLQGL